MAGSISCTSDKLYGDSRVVEFLLTHDDGTPDANLSVTLNGVVTGLVNGGLEGWLANVFQTKPGSTAPTDATDLTIKDDYGMDILGAGGANMVDNTTGQEFYAEVNNIADFRLIHSALTVATTGNEVNSATFYLRAWLKRG